MRKSVLLAAGLLALGAGAATAQVQDAGDYLRRMDLDGDGRVAPDEYQRWMRYAFERMDRDGNGVLEPAEQPGGRGRPITRESAQQRLYGWDEDVASNALDVHVHALRRKLDPALIRTLRGVGYALDEQVAQASAVQGGDAA